MPRLQSGYAQKLQQVESRALSKADDGSYVKELAVLVLGHKTLFNSSLTKREYSKNQDGEQNKKNAQE